MMKMKVVLLAACFLAVNPESIAQNTGIEQIRDRYLLIDSRMIDNTENAELCVGTVKKHKNNPLFAEDKPWEMRFDNLYANVMYDSEDQLYKCWYSPFIVDYSSKGKTMEERKKPYEDPENREMGICYAISADGIHWEKPDLGIVEYAGNKNNNIVWRGPHGAGVFKDPGDPDAERRYKTIFQGLAVSHSPDGIHWEEKKSLKGISLAGDTHNNAFWAPTLGRYVGISRSWGDFGREVVRIESEDFRKWSNEKVIMHGITENLQTYAMPVFFHGGIYLGLVAIHDQEADRVWTELAWSPDTEVWERISPGTALIPCSEQELSYDYGCVYAAASPVFLEDEIRLYYGGSDWLHFSWRNGSFCLATLRPDGFAGYKQRSKEKEAILTTVPVAYSGQELLVTADVEEGGFLKVEILDRQGKSIAKAKTIRKSVTDEALSLSNDISLDRIRLRFEFTGSTVYSYCLKSQKE